MLGKLLVFVKVKGSFHTSVLEKKSHSTKKNSDPKVLKKILDMYCGNLIANEK